MAVGLIASISDGFLNGGTTGSIDSSGANFLLVAVAMDDIASGNVSDSKSNTWTPVTSQSGNGTASIRFFYAYNATVGSGHTFTVTCSAGAAPGIAVGAFSNVRTTPDPVTDSDGATSSSATTSGNIPALTPSASTDLVVTALTNHLDSSNNDRTAGSAGATFTIFQERGIVGGVSYSIAMAWSTNYASDTINWGWTSGAQPSNTIAIDVIAAAGAATTRHGLPYQGVG